MSRARDLDRLYSLLSRLEERVGGKRHLDNCTGRMNWPDRGVYFFFAPDETRDDDEHLRITRVGTHAVTEGSGTTLWNRLRQHRGTLSGGHPGGGNHRGSVFRKEVGNALIQRDDLQEKYNRWGEGSSLPKGVSKDDEHQLEKRVSEYIRNLPFLWIEVDDEPGRDSQRAYIEQNTIALLSNFGKPPIDQRAEDWLGKHSPKRYIREPELWNSNHVDEEYDSHFLDELEKLIGGVM